MNKFEEPIGRIYLENYNNDDIKITIIEYVISYKNKRKVKKIDNYLINKEHLRKHLKEWLNENRV